MSEKVAVKKILDEHYTELLIPYATICTFALLKPEFIIELLAAASHIKTFFYSCILFILGVGASLSYLWLIEVLRELKVWKFEFQISPIIGGGLLVWAMLITISQIPHYKDIDITKIETVVKIIRISGLYFMGISTLKYLGRMNEASYKMSSNG